MFKPSIMGCKRLYWKSRSCEKVSSEGFTDLEFKRKLAVSKNKRAIS